MRHGLRTVIPALLLAIVAWTSPILAVQEGVSAGERPPVNPGAIQSAPAIAASSFYHWYLHTLANNQEPLRDRATLQRYLSSSLLDQVEHAPKDADQDYFMKAQDYLDDWVSHIAVSDVKIDGGTASVIVTLGNTNQSKRRLVLRLVNENGAWNIVTVNLGRPSRKSPPR